MDTTPDSIVAEIDRHIEEGSALIARAEACRQSLIACDAREGHLLMAARTITAMNRVQATLLRQRTRLRQQRGPDAALPEVEVVPAVVVVAPAARPWWALIGGRRRGEARPS